MFRFSRVQKCHTFGPVPLPMLILENEFNAALISSRFGLPVKSSSCKSHCSKQIRFNDGKCATATRCRFVQWKHSMSSSDVNPVKSSVSPIGLYEEAQYRKLVKGNGK